MQTGRWIWSESYQFSGVSSNADDQEAIANNTAELLPPDVYDSGVEAWSGKHDPDQTISYQYDENGNLTEKSGSDIDTFSYQYDNENRLRAVMQNGTVLMAALYDGNGDRIFKLQRHSTSGNVPSSDEEKKDNNGKNVPHGNKKTKELLEEEQTVSAETTETQNLTSSGDIPVDLELLEDTMLLPTGANKTNIESFDLTGYINNVNQQYTQVLMEYGKNGKYNSIYSYGLQRLGADYSGAQTVYLYDGRGSMVNETNGSGTSMSAYLYDEWGNLLSGKVHTNGFYSDLYLYNGEATDITTGLQYLRARYYDPEMGRFIQQDSYLGKTSRPLSQNRYIYVENNPLNYIDPSGHMSVDELRTVSKAYNAGFITKETVARIVLLRNTIGNGLTVDDLLKKYPKKNNNTDVPSVELEKDYEYYEDRWGEKSFDMSGFNLSFHEITQVLAAKELRESKVGQAVSLEKRINGKEADIVIDNYVYEVKTRYSFMNYSKGDEQLNEYTRNNSFQRGPIPENFGTPYLVNKMTTPDSLKKMVKLFTYKGDTIYLGYTGHSSSTSLKDPLSSYEDGKIAYYIKIVKTKEVTRKCESLSPSGNWLAKKMQDMYKKMFPVPGVPQEDPDTSPVPGGYSPAPAYSNAEAAAYGGAAATGLVGIGIGISAGSGNYPGMIFGDRTMGSTNFSRYYDVAW